MTVRVAPHDLDAEKGLIGACLVAYKALDDHAVDVAPEDFYAPAHQRIWEAMLVLRQRGSRPDHITVAAMMKQAGTWSETTDLLVAECIADAGSAGSAKGYARIVRDHAKLRTVLEATHEIERMIYEPDGKTTQQIVEAAEVTILEALKQRGGENEPVSLAQAGAEWLQEFEKQRTSGSDGFGARTGLGQLDNDLAGLRGGQLITVAARPGAGKSQLLAQAAIYVATHSGPVLFCSLEMKRREIAERIIAARAGISLSSIRVGRLTSDEIGRAVDQVADFERSQMWFVDQPKLTVPAVHAQARRLRARYGLALVVVDYLQLMAPTKQRDNRQVEVSSISAGLKELAMDLDVPVLAAAQLNRLLEYRNDKKPSLADLRESGAIEQDSDVVMAIYRPSMYFEPPCEPDELLILKQRSGPTGSVQVRYDAEHGVFSGIAHHRELNA